MNRCSPGCFSIKLISLLFVLFMISGCGSKTMVVLMPDLDGKVGAVNVSNSAGSIDIATTHQATTVSGRKSSPSVPVVLKKQEIEAVFLQALRAQPKAPVHFLLYFISGSNELREDSLAVVEAIIQTIEKRSSVYISIVGHTDTVGTDEYNYTLSKGRAEAVARLLVTREIGRASCRERV